MRRGLALWTKIETVPSRRSQVGQDEARVTSLVAQAARDFLAAFGVDVGHQDTRALAGECAGDAAADARGRAGHQRTVPGQQLWLHTLSPSSMRFFQRPADHS
jgi:hypothetical protein